MTTANVPLPSKRLLLGRLGLLVFIVFLIQILIIFIIEFIQIIFLQFIEIVCIGVVVLEIVFVFIFVIRLSNVVFIFHIFDLLIGRANRKKPPWCAIERLNTRRVADMLRS